MEHTEHSPLYRIMHPRSIAFWGASSNPLGMGSVQLRQILDLNFEGPIYPIHPRETEVMGLKAYPDIKSVPGPVDLAVLILPTSIVAETLEQCGEAGIKGVIVVSAGFGERGEEGKAEQQKLVDIADRYGMKFVGPNCIGVVNTAVKLNTTFFPYEAEPGFIGMVSQSGSFVTQMFEHLQKFGLGFSQAVSVGNEAHTDMTDWLEYLGDCPDTKVVALYIETIRRGREFVRVAKEVSKKKPIVAFYVGGSEGGGRAALSHTGALAGPDKLYSGIFRQCGIVRAWNSEELFDLCWVLGSQPKPNGNRVAILTHSGGPGAAAADAADRAALELPRFTPETEERLRAIVPVTASISNPVDLTFNRDPQEYTQTLPGILLEDPNIDSLFIYLLLPSRRVLQSVSAMTHNPEQAEEMTVQFIRSQCQAVAKLTQQYGKPVIGASYSPHTELFIQELQKHGVPCLPSPERAMKALAGLSRLK